MTISAPITITPIQITAPVTFGMIGPQGPNAVTSATTSDGTATLSLAGITIAAFTSGHVVTVTTGGAFTTTSRSGIDTRSTFPPSAHTHTASEVTDFAAAVAATPPQPHTHDIADVTDLQSQLNTLVSELNNKANASHSHGNIGDGGTIGSTSGLVVTTGAAGILETSSRSGIDTRTSFPNDDVTAASYATVANTIPRRDSHGDIRLHRLYVDGTVGLSESLNSQIVVVATSMAAIDAISEDGEGAKIRSTNGNHINIGNGKLIVANNGATTIASYLSTTGTGGAISTTGNSSPIITTGTSSYIQTEGTGSYIQTRSTFRLFNGVHITTLTHAPTDNHTITFQDTDGTVAHLSDITVNLNNTATLTNKTLTAPTITNPTESTVTGGNTSTAVTLSLTNGTAMTYTLTGNCTFTMPTAAAGKSFTLFLNTGTGSYTGTFTGVKWSGNTAPTITTTASRMDILSFASDGTNWYGSIIQNFTP